jgi:hypothetical protein
MLHALIQKRIPKEGMFNNYLKTKTSNELKQTENENNYCDSQ